MGMEKKIKALQSCITVLTIAIVAFIFRISALENEVSRLDYLLDRQYDRIMSDVNAIYQNVDEKLREEASLLSAVEAEYGEFDLENHTIDVTVKLVPKLISEEMKVQVSINGRTAALSRTGNIFTGTIPVDIYNMGEWMLLTIDTAAGTQTQYLNEIQVEYIWTEKIPSLYYCDISGDETFEDGKYTLNGHLDINCSPAADTPDVKFEKFVLVTELNGKDIKREDITEEVLNYESYPHGVYWRSDYNMDCDVVEGDELGIYLEATDSLGYLHRMLLHHWKVLDDATAEAVDGSEYIYDPNGVQIFPQRQSLN